MQTPAPEFTNLNKYKETGEFEDVKGRLDFQNAMDDLTKNYEWLKEKSYKSLIGLEEKYDQMRSDLEELNKRISSYSINDNPAIKQQRMSGQRIAPLKDTEKKIIINVLDDVFGLVGYTSDSINVALENSFEDIEILKEAITEYNELLEDKIKKLPTIISSSNLKSEERRQKSDNLYDLYLAGGERSDKSDGSQPENLVETELKKDIKRLSSQVNHWKKGHKQLFDAVNENQKLLSKMMKSKETGRDGLAALQQLYSKSNKKLKDLVISHYELHYSKSKKPKSKREKSDYPHSISPTREFKSAAVLATQEVEDVGTNQELVTRIDNLRKEISQLRPYKDKAESLEKDHLSILSKNKLLKEEYEAARDDYDKLQREVDKKDHSINELTRSNTKLNERIVTLQSENKSLENLLHQNRDNDYENLREYKNTLNRTKKSCEAQISGIEKEFEGTLDTLQEQLTQKDRKLRSLENKLNEFKLNYMNKMQQEANDKISQKLSEIQQLNSRNKDLKSTIDELTQDKEKTENTLKRTQSMVRDLQRQLKDSEEEQLNLRKVAEEQETIASSLYEDRLNEKNKEIEDLGKEIDRKENEIQKLKKDAISLDTKLCNFENKVKGVHSLVVAYSEQLDQDEGRTNPTVKLIKEELSSVLTSEGPSETQAIDRLNQMRELISEKEKLEAQVRQLKQDVTKEIEKAESIQRKHEKSEKDLKRILEDRDKEIKDKDDKIETLENQLRGKEEMVNKANFDKNKMEKNLEDESKRNQKFEKLIFKYRTFADKICTFFEYEESASKEEDYSDKPILNGLFNHLVNEKKMREEVLLKAEEKIRELREQLNDLAGAPTKEQLDELALQLEKKEEEIAKLNEDLNNIRSKEEESDKEVNEKETIDKEKQKLNEVIAEKNENIANYIKTLENMRSTILKLRDNLQSKIDEVAQKEKEIIDQKLSLLSTLNSHITAAGFSDPREKEFTDANPPDFDTLYKIVVDKIQKTKSKPKEEPVKQLLQGSLSNLEEQNKELNNQLRDLKESLEKKDKEFKLISKQRDTLRAQLGSAVEMMNSKESDMYANRGFDSDILPSLQSQIQTLQDESKQSEVTRDMTEHIIDSFEKNDRKMREQLEKLHNKIAHYKERLKEQKAIIKELQKGDMSTKEAVGLRTQLTAEIKKKIREEEITKRDKEIERQRRLMSSKSEEQALQFNQKVEELEAKLEAKDDEITEYLIKVQEAEREIERLKQSKDRKSVLSLEDQLDDLTSSPARGTKTKNYDNQMKILEKVERLDEKIIELGEKIGNYRIEIMDKLEDELDEINNAIYNSNHGSLGDNVVEKLQKMKESNMVVQVVRKLETEGFNWLLLEKKDPLDKPLELKTSHSLSKSSLEHHPGGRKLFWVCEEGLKEELLEYVFSYTPKFLLKSESLKLTIPELFSEESDRQAWQMLKDSTKELAEKRKEILKEQREIKLGLRRENFLLGKYKTLLNISFTLALS